MYFFISHKKCSYFSVKSGKSFALKSYDFMLNNLFPMTTDIFSETRNSGLVQPLLVDGRLSGVEWFVSSHPQRLIVSGFHRCNLPSRHVVLIKARRASRGLIKSLISCSTSTHQRQKV